MRSLLGVLTALGGLLLVAVAVAIGTPASAATTTCPGTFTTAVTNRPDSGAHGDWAKDTFTRTTTVECLGDNKYKLTLADVGTFTTVAGLSPGTGVVLPVGITGSFTGGATVVVTSETPPVAPPSTSDGTVSSSEWAKLLFPGNAGVISAWHWVYSTKCETWTNVETGSSGDVTGKTCETTTTTIPPSSTTGSTVTTTGVTTTTGSSQTSTATTTSRTSRVWPTTTTTRRAAPVHVTGNDDLAYTGTGGVGPLLTIGGLLVLLGGFAIMTVLRRNRRRDQPDAS